MTRAEFDARHRERYRKVLLRQITLAQALEENERDWLRLKRA